jgi:hypothetical protein
VEGVEDRRSEYRVLAGKPEENNHLEGLSVDGKIKLKWNFKTRDAEAWTGFI